MATGSDHGTLSSKSTVCELQTEGGERTPPTGEAPKQGPHRQEGEGARGAQGGPTQAGEGPHKATPTPTQEGAPPGDPTQEREQREGSHNKTESQTPVGCGSC